MAYYYKRKKKYNSLKTGLIPAFILPFLSVGGFYFFKFHSIDKILDIINQIFYMSVFTQILALGALPNLLLFFVFIWTDRYLSARGVIIATFVYAIFVLILKYSL